MRPGRFEPQRRQPVIRDHHRQCQCRENDHAGSGAQPPDEGQQGHTAIALGKRKRQNEQIRIDAARSQSALAGQCNRKKRNGHQQHVQGKQPTCGFQIASITGFDETDMELMRQRDHGKSTKQHQRGKSIGTATADRLRYRRTQVEIQPDIQAEREHGTELQQGLDRHRQHQAPVAFADRCTPRSEQHGKCGHHQRNVKRAVAPSLGRILVIAAQHAITHGDRFELQGNVGNDADHGNGGDCRRQGGIPSESAGNQIGNRCGVIVLRQLVQFAHKGEGKNIEQHAADKGRRNRPTGTQCLGDRAVKRPGRAVHGQGQAIDIGPVSG